MCINIDEIFDHDYTIYGKGPFVHLNKGTYLILKDYNKYFFEIFNNQNLPYDFHFNTSNLGDYLLLADLGWLLYSNKDITEEGLTVSGMHGYNPKYKEMHGIFYAYGPKFKQYKHINEFELIHIYPLLCKLLNIDPYEDIDGKLEILNDILR